MSRLNSELVQNETNKFDDVLKDYVRVTAAGQTLLEKRFELLGKLQIAQAKNSANVTSLTTEFQKFSTSAGTELDNFKEAKTKDIREALREVVRVNMEHQQKVVSLWKELLSDLEEHWTSKI